MLLLIVIYTLYILFQIGVNDREWFKKIQKKIFIAELVVLGLFAMEIILYIFSYGCLYLKDYWNMADIVVILISIALVAVDLDANSDSGILKDFLKVSSIFRLLRVFLLARKLNIVKTRREIRKMATTVSGYDLRSPLERVIAILEEFKSLIDPGDEKLNNDMSYCITMISSNKLYEA
jgi:prepilin signal peptidase PulO-like enzyme (type II secretory pathway)